MRDSLAKCAPIDARTRPLIVLLEGPCRCNEPLAFIRDVQFIHSGFPCIPTKRNPYFASSSWPHAIHPLLTLVPAMGVSGSKMRCMVHSRSIRRLLPIIQLKRWWYYGKCSVGPCLVRLSVALARFVNICVLCRKVFCILRR